MTIVFITFVSALVAVPGAKLFLLARRTRKAPEALLSAFFSSCAAGIFLRLLGVGGALAPGPVVDTATLAAHVILTAGLVAAVWFARLVFRPTSAWATRLAVALSALLVTTCAALFVPGNIEEGSAAVLVANTSRILPFIWLFAESSSQHARLRRQARLGLGDPIVTNRFLLWSIWTGLLAALPIVVVGLRIATRISNAGQGDEEIAAAQLQAIGHLRIVMLLVAGGVATGVWLSFFPSRRYVAFVAARGSARD